jgi:hypothetical protein
MNEVRKETKMKKLSEMTDAEVFAEANRDRAEGLGSYHMTPAMEEELRRMNRNRNQWGDPVNGIWDED